MGGALSMKINDINKKQPLYIEVSDTNGKTTTSIPVKFVKFIQNGILVESIIINGRNVRFDSENVVVNLCMKVPDGKPVRWRNVTIKNVQDNGIPGVAIIAMQEGFAYLNKEIKL